jgi:oligopeptide transport system substrate-binding protein
MKNIFAAICLVLAMMLAAGCKKKDQAMQGDFKPALGGKVYGGTFTDNAPSDLPTLDPVQVGDVTSHYATNQVYDLLVDFNQATLKLEPELATSWEVSDDGKLYTFHLRTDVYFQDDPCFPNGKGKKFTAADVKYSFERACNPQNQTKGFFVFENKVNGANEYFKAMEEASKTKAPSKVTEVAGFWAKDDSTFTVMLGKPFSPFVLTMTTAFCYITCKEAVEYYKENFRMHPVGTGAFQFDDFKDAQYLLLKRNPHYWQKDSFGNQLPFLDAWKQVYIKTLSSQFMETKKGNLQNSYRIPQEFRGKLFDENGNLTDEAKGLQYQHVPALSTQFYGLLYTSPMFKDRRVRQAFNYAIDREKICKYVLKGEGIPATGGIVPPSMPDYGTSVKGYTYDVAKAKQLMAEAGYPDGKGFSKVTLQINTGGTRNVQVAEAMQDMLTKNLGITVELSQVEWATHLYNMEHGKVPFYRLGWIADYPDPETFLNQFYGKLVPKDTAAESYPNTSRYNNPKFDEAYEKALATTNDFARFALYREAEQIAMDDAAMLLILHDEDQRFIGGNVRDFPINAMDRRDFKAVWFDVLNNK